MRPIHKLLIALLFLMTLPTGAEPKFEDVPALHTSAVGYAGTESEVYKSFRAVLNKGEKARPIFQRCLKSGTPAAKLYSAIGLYKLDPEEGKAALKSLADSEEKVPYMRGCIVSTQTVGELATNMLSGKLSLVSF